MFHVARKEVVGLLAGRHALLGSGDIAQLAHVADDLGLRDVAQQACGRLISRITGAAKEVCVMLPAGALQDPADVVQEHALALDDARGQ